MTVIKKNQILVPFLSTKLKYIPGQDPMGMLNIGEQVFSMLLPGLNNVTGRIRYYSFYCWFMEWYAKDIGSENPKVFYKYLRRAEYLLALIAVKSDTRGLPGITEAIKNYSDDKSEFSLSYGTGEDKGTFENTYWKNARGIFGQNYVSSLKAIGIIREKEEDSKLYIRSAFQKDNIVTGKDLAFAFNEAITAAARDAFIEGLLTGTVTQQALEVMMECFTMKSIKPSSQEQQFLLDMLLGADLPLDLKPTFFRRETSKHYLQLLKDKESVISERDFVLYAYEQRGMVKNKPNETLTSWYYFQLSQYWHMVCTGCFMHLLNALRITCDGSWEVEQRFITNLTDDILSHLKSSYNLQDDTLFKDLPLLEDSNTSISQQIHTTAYAQGISVTLLLLKKILFENKPHIERLKQCANGHTLHSESDFVTRYDSLEKLSELPLRAFILIFLKKYIIERHQIVAYNKITASQTSEKFIREDGLIRFIEGIGLDFSSARLHTLISFYEDLGIISKDDNTLTAQGAMILKELYND